MFLRINLKFANQIGNIYRRDKARSTGSASGKRERVTINWGKRVYRKELCSVASPMETKEVRFYVKGKQIEI